MVLALALPLTCQESGGKVKVVVENASIRLKPSLDSEAIEENIPVGTVYAANKKTGEWYEIKFESKLGVALLGYIHEMYVEFVGEAAPPEPEVKQPEVRQPEVRQPERPPQPEVPRLGNPKMEVFLGGGLGLGSFLNESTSYVDDWTIGFVNGHEEGEIKHKVNTPFGLGLSASYFLTEGLGIRLRLDPGFGQKISGGQSLYSVNFFGGWGSLPYSDEWNVSGSLSALPLSLDLVYRFPAGMLTPYVNAGVSYFLASFKADTTVGWGYAWYLTYPTLMTAGYAEVPASIDEKLNKVGFNLGAGFDFHLGPSLAVTMDVAYFLGGKSDLGWSVAPGTYPFATHSGVSIAFDQATAQRLSDLLGTVRISLSFLKIVAGIKLFF